jgi:2-oxoglutarate ferredoxin oxidoreductase subunit alpha
VEAILVVEMNAGQMVDDVRLGVGGLVPVSFLGHTGGVVPLPDEILDRIVSLNRQFAPNEPEIDEWNELVGASFPG